MRERRSKRIKGYDYSHPGAYFVTVCAHNRDLLFGEIKDGMTILNEYGEIVKKEWTRTPRIRVNIDIDIFAVMPNHLHRIKWFKPKNSAIPQKIPFPPS